MWKGGKGYTQGTWIFPGPSQPEEKVALSPLKVTALSGAPLLTAIPSAFRKHPSSHPFSPTPPNMAIEVIAHVWVN